MKQGSITLIKTAGLFCLIWAATNTAVGVTQLDRGHRLFREKGLQIGALVHPFYPSSFSLSKWSDSNFTTVSFAGSTPMSYLGSAPGIPWGLQINDESAGSSDRGDNYLLSSEKLNLANLVYLQFADEMPITGDDLTRITNALASWRTRYPTVLGFTDQSGGAGISHADFRTYMETAEPDMLMVNNYPYVGINAGGSPIEFYSTLTRYRYYALNGNDGNGDTPIPYGAYIQGFHYDSTTPHDTHSPSESEIRLNQFSAWAFGNKMVIAWFYNTDVLDWHVPIFFTGVGDTNSTDRFDYVAETNRQSRNLGPALVNLLSTDIRINLGQHKSGGSTVNNTQPTNLALWTNTADPYMTSLTAANTGSKNDSLPGDVLVGYFKPLCEEDDGTYTNQEYFMVVNGLSDASGTCSETTQTITMDFDFSSTPGIIGLQRMRRSDGVVETIIVGQNYDNLTWTNTGPYTYQLVLTLPGGTGDLFKYNTGAPFVVGKATGLWADVTYDSSTTKNNVNGGTDKAGYAYTSNKPTSGTWTCDYSLEPGSDAINVFSSKFIEFNTNETYAKKDSGWGTQDSSLVVKISLSNYITAATWTPIRFYCLTSTNSSVVLKYSTDGANFTTCYTSPTGTGYVYPGTLSLSLAAPTKTLYIAYVGTIGDGTQAFWRASGGSLEFTADTREFDEWTDIYYYTEDIKSQINGGTDTGGYSYSSEKPLIGPWTETFNLDSSSGAVNVWSAQHIFFDTTWTQPNGFGLVQDSSLILKVNLSQPITSVTWDLPATHRILKGTNSITARYSVDGKNFTTCYTYPSTNPEGSNTDPDAVTFSVPSTRTLYLGLFGTIGNSSYCLYRISSTGLLTFTPDPSYWVDVTYNPNDGTVKPHVNGGTDTAGYAYTSSPVPANNETWGENYTLETLYGDLSVCSANYMTINAGGIVSTNWGDQDNAFIVKVNLGRAINAVTWSPARISRYITNNGSVKLKYSTDGVTYKTLYHVPVGSGYDTPAALNFSVPAGTQTLYLGWFGYAPASGDYGYFETESTGSISFHSGWFGITYDPNDGTVKPRVNEGMDVGGYGYSSTKPTDNSTWQLTSHSVKAETGNDVAVYSAKNITFSAGGVVTTNWTDTHNYYVFKVDLSQPIAAASWTPPRIYYSTANTGSVKLKYSTDGVTYATLYTLPTGVGFDWPTALSIPSLPTGTKALYLGWFGDAPAAGDYNYYSFESTGSVTFTPGADYWTNVTYSPDDTTVEAYVNDGTDAGGCAYTSTKPADGIWQMNCSTIPGNGYISVYGANNVTFTAADARSTAWGDHDSSLILRVNFSEPVTTITWAASSTYCTISNNGSVRIGYSTNGVDFTYPYTFPTGAGYTLPPPVLISVPAGTQTLYVGWFGTAPTTNDMACFMTEYSGAIACDWLDNIYDPDDNTVQPFINDGTDRGGYIYTSTMPENNDPWEETYPLDPRFADLSVWAANYIKFKGDGIEVPNWGNYPSSFAIRIDTSEIIASATWTPGRLYRHVTNSGSVVLKYSTDGIMYTTLYTLPSGSGYVYPPTLSISSLPVRTRRIYLGWFGTNLSTSDSAYYSTESTGLITFTQGTP